MHCTTQLEVGFGGVSDSGFSLCTAPTYYFRSEYLLVSVHKFGVGFGSKFSGTEMDYQIESGKIFGPMCSSMHEDFGH